MLPPEAAKARRAANEHAENLSEYFEGFDALRYLWKYELTYRATMDVLRTWRDAKPYFSQGYTYGGFLYSPKIISIETRATQMYASFLMNSTSVLEYLLAHLLVEKIDVASDPELAVEAMKSTPMKDQKRLFEKSAGDEADGIDLTILDQRWEFAHQFERRLEITKQDRQRVHSAYSAVRDLTEMLYHRDYNELVSLLERSFNEPNDSTSITDIPTLQLARLHALYESFNDSTFRQDPDAAEKRVRCERELSNRGYDPAVAVEIAAPKLTEYERNHLLDAFNEAHKPLRLGGVSHYRLLDYQIPDEVDQGMRGEFSIKFRIDDAPYKDNDPRTEVFCYPFLLVNDEVVYSSLPDEQEPNEAEIYDEHDTIEFSFDYSFKNPGFYDTYVGVHIETKQPELESVILSPRVEVEAIGPTGTLRK